MTTLEYIEQLQKNETIWILEGNLLDFITFKNYYPEVFIAVKIESFDGVTSIVFETKCGYYTYENFKFRNYQKLSLEHNAELSMFFDNEKETAEAILTTESGIYKFLFEITIGNISEGT